MRGHAVALENACKDVVFLVETQVVTKLVVVNGVEGAVSALPACVARLARSTARVLVSTRGTEEQRGHQW